ncbi:hypothetical protein [Paenibacillus typhae]|uniref:hypothetical protein n=1 Tax=Paenibacillus typhae TaxID=1174501 RepID=UPI001C8D005E|nr:hypothetical protein [Paenibacillus typhae]MBY0011506.1 hypothetical protein [Paenibacillus typhae]
MANIRPTLQIEIDPRRPVPEICAVISATLPFHPPGQEEAILNGVKEAIEKQLGAIKKGAENHAKPVHGPSGSGADQ